MKEAEIEKQAVEYAIEDLPDGYTEINHIKKQAFQDGAEWGMEHSIKWHDLRKDPNDLPTYEELARVKRDFIGDDKKAVMVLPEKSNHVNIHENCLHLFYSAENSLPEFSANGLI